MPVNPQDLLALGVAGLVNILIMVMFCRSLIKALSFISPENQTIKPGTIWLLLIPGLNYIINFIVVTGMSKSISNELISRDFEEEDRPTYAAGLTFAVLSLASLIGFFPIPTNLLALVSLIGFSQIFFFVRYWMKINWYKNVLENDEEGQLDEGEE